MSIHAAKVIDYLLTERARIDAQIREVLRRDEAVPTGRRSRYAIPECGTETAYQRHHYRRDTATDERVVTCAPCIEAHRLHARVQYARKHVGETAAAYVQSRGVSA